jgi:hypothetical protein
MTKLIVAVRNIANAITKIRVIDEFIREWAKIVSKLAECIAIAAASNFMLTYSHFVINVFLLF